MQNPKPAPVVHLWRLASEVAVKAEIALADKSLKHLHGVGPPVSDEEANQVAKLRAHANVLYDAAMAEIDQATKLAARLSRRAPQVPE